MKLDVSLAPVHTRCLSVALKQGVGESVEFRADIMDLRKAGLMALGGRIATAGIIHKMELTGAFSSVSSRIERIEWEQSHVMHEANQATQGECCRDPMVRLRGLIGTPLGEGFASELKQCFGGPLGCTHINTLFHELCAFVARLRGAARDHTALQTARKQGERIAARSIFFDAFMPENASETVISVRLADILFAESDPTGRECLFSHDELRLVAEVELAGWQLRSVKAKERCRRGPECGETPWRKRDAELGDFAGQSLRSGMTRYCLEHLGERDQDARLLSALLSLAPGMTQVGVILFDGLGPSPSTSSPSPSSVSPSTLSSSSSSSSSTLAASAAQPGGLAAMGPGPCYMLRADGPLVQTLSSGHPRAAGNRAKKTTD